MPTTGRVDVPPVVRERFVADLDARSTKGVETYGRILQTHNGRDAGQDAWEELIDLAQYLTQLRLERDDLMAERDDLAEQLMRHQSHGDYEAGFENGALVAGAMDAAAVAALDSLFLHLGSCQKCGLRCGFGGTLWSEAREKMRTTDGKFLRRTMPPRTAEATS